MNAESLIKGRWRCNFFGLNRLDFGLIDLDSGPELGSFCVPKGHKVFRISLAGSVLRVFKMGSFGKIYIFAK